MGMSSLLSLCVPAMAASVAAASKGPSTLAASLALEIGLIALAVGAQPATNRTVSSTPAPSASASAAPDGKGISNVEAAALGVGLFFIVAALPAALFWMACGWSCCCCDHRRRHDEFRYREFIPPPRIQITQPPPRVDAYPPGNSPNEVPLAQLQRIAILTQRCPADEPTTSRTEIGGEVRGVLKESYRESSDHLPVIQSQENRHKRLRRISAQIPQDEPEADFSVLLTYWDQTIAATEIQRLFDDEHRRLGAERAALQAQRFTCIACDEECPEDDIAPIPGCTHTFCRECLCRYVVSEFTKKVLPTFCPVCAVNNARGNPGFITNDLVKTLGLTDEQYQVFQELELVPLFTFLECPKCKEPLFVDRTVYEAAVFLVCPVERCNHTWCKKCGKTIIDLAALEHECAGEAELQVLMRRQGWKYCPGCHTPCDKIEGCNHMQCPSPGCKTHFCYKCGELIVRSASAHETSEAVRTHYRRCIQFEYPDVQ